MAAALLQHSEFDAQDFYRRSLAALNEANEDYLVGGAYALARYIGVARHTRDLDLFTRQRDLEPVLDVLARAGYRTEITFPHWLGKAFSGPELVDVIHSSGNGVVIVDDEWFEHAPRDRVLGVDVNLCPAEEMIWSKAFIMERERFDGGDILHLIRSRGHALDWPRIVRRFGDHFRVLLSHLVLFGFVYPSEKELIPRWVMTHLMRRLARDERVNASDGRVCRGTLLSRAQFLVDIEHWGYEDARLDPDVRMTSEHIAQWTEAIDAEVRTYDGTQRDR